MRKLLVIFVCTAMLTLQAPAGIFGQESLSELTQHQNEIRLVLGNITRFKVDGLTKVEIENPKIADIVNANSDEIIIEPKSAGVTGLAYADQTGEHKVFLRILQRDLEALRRGVDEVIENTGIQGIETKINYEAQKVYLIGQVINDTDRKRLKSALGPMVKDVIDVLGTQEQKVPIEIDVEVVELDKNDVDNLGVKWNLAPLTTITEYPFPAPDYGSLTKLDRVATRVTEGFRIGYTSRAEGETGTGIQAAINLLVQKGKGKILSRPKLVCLSGKEAEFLVGGEVPVVTVTTSGDTTQTPNVEYKKYGVSLKIKPRIKENGEIELNVNTEVKDIDKNYKVGISGVDAPAFTIRSAQTDLYLKENDTVFLAGLISNKESDTIQKMPFLGGVPILGWLFKNKNKTKDQIELLISLTPRIIKLPADNISAMQQEPVYVDLAKQDIVENILEESDISFQKENVALQEYGRTVQMSIADSVLLPRSHTDTSLTVALVLAPDGYLKDIFLKKSSGDESIDEAVLDAIRKKTIFPAFPAQLKQNEVQLDIPIIFEKSLQG